MAEEHKTTHHQKYQSNPFDLLRPSYEGTKLNLKTYLLLILAAIGLFGGLALVCYLLFKAVPIIAVLFGIAAGLWLMIRVAPVPVRLTLAMAHHKRIEFGDAIEGPFSLGWKMFWTQFLAALIILGGFILLIVPGIIFSIWYVYVSYVVFEEGLTGMAALRRSKQLVSNRFWDVMGSNCVTSVFGILNIIPVLGSIASLIISLLLIPVPALRYLQLKELKEHSDGKDIVTSKWNYAAIAATILLTGWSFSNSMHQPQTTQPQLDNSYYLETQ